MTSEPKTKNKDASNLFHACDTWLALSCKNLTDDDEELSDGVSSDDEAMLERERMDVVGFLPNMRRCPSVKQRRRQRLSPSPTRSSAFRKQQVPSEEMRRHMIRELIRASEIV